MNTKFYNASAHISNLKDDDYYYNLILLRNSIHMAIDKYFQKLEAPNVDLFLISKGVSSPTGKGSNSVPIPIKFGDQKTFLIDSAQFGMEPLVQKNFKIVYCYLPSFRGENPDDRHLNQFYHCETELRGDYIECMAVAEKLVKFIFKELLKSYNMKKFNFKNNNFSLLDNIIGIKFPVITFDEACKVLEENNLAHLIHKFPYGRVLTNEAEIQIAKLIGKNKYPVWITKYDRNTVPFYQMPDLQNSHKTLNADLIFPKIRDGLGGETLGLGQRQNTSKGILFSMKQQSVRHVDSYGWYINLRDQKDYQTTSGFGLGIERLITWVLGLNSIIDAAIYPVLKGENPAV